MLIDGILVILLVLAAIKGYQRGLIVGIFSFLAILIGLAAAMKLSAVTADYIGQSVSVSRSWLPFISFVLVFIVVVLLVRLGANLIQKTVELGMMGWINRLGGVLLYVLIYVTVYSIVLFYAVKLELIKQETINSSAAYVYISPVGPWFINAFAMIIPLFRDMFADLSGFFDGVATEATPHQ